MTAQWASSHWAGCSLWDCEAPVRILESSILDGSCQGLVEPQADRRIASLQNQSYPDIKELYDENQARSRGYERFMSWLGSAASMTKGF